MLDNTCDNCEGIGILFLKSTNKTPPTIKRCEVCKQYESDDEALEIIRECME